jgi:putative endonuclease
MDNIRLGAQGEYIAINFLQRKGFKLIERNFKKPQGDIDIIMLDKGTLVFVEVKTRTSRKYGLPVEAITPWKIRQLMKNAYLYKLYHPELPEALRIDFVGVDYVDNPNEPVIEHIPNITG